MYLSPKRINAVAKKLTRMTREEQLEWKQSSFGKDHLFTCIEGRKVVIYSSGKMKLFSSSGPGRDEVVFRPARGKELYRAAVEETFSWACDFIGEVLEERRPA